MDSSPEDHSASSVDHIKEKLCINKTKKKQTQTQNQTQTQTQTQNRTQNQEQAIVLITEKSKGQKESNQPVWWLCKG
tara:strand:+ start:971 stop:1201 length:231 start_codon:yes stop_codon:yes gene_type:complete